MATAQGILPGPGTQMSNRTGSLAKASNSLREARNKNRKQHTTNPQQNAP
jgi:hypothetical protein